MSLSDPVSIPKTTARWRSLLLSLPNYDPFAATEIDGVGRCEFEPKSAVRVIRFFHEHLRHIEGAVAGKPFILMRWQAALLANLFGWKRPNGTRRYRESLIFVSRKAGKSPMAAGIGDYLVSGDGEVGALVQCAATSFGQASKLFRYAKGMLEANPDLAAEFRFWDSAVERKLMYLRTASTLEVIHAKAPGQHGGTPSAVIYDELHAAPNDDLYRVLRTSMASENRLNPLFIVTTTSDVERDSPCNEVEKHADEVRADPSIDPEFLPCVFKADPGDDYRKRSTWVKANPGIGVTVSENYLRRESRNAEKSPAARSEFRRLHCNQKTAIASAWIGSEEWAENDGAVPEGREFDGGWPCAIGVDLAATRDLTAVVTVLNVEGVYLWLPRFFCPAESLYSVGRFQAKYERWKASGLLTATPGQVTDYAVVEEAIVEDAAKYGAREIAFDAKLGGMLMSRLEQEHGLTVFGCSQGITSMSPMLKLVESLVGERKIDHRGHEILAWNVEGAAVKRDENDNVKLVKNRSTTRIDGLIAGTMATYRLATTVEPVTPFMGVIL